MSKSNGMINRYLSKSLIILIVFLLLGSSIYAQDKVSDIRKLMKQYHEYGKFSGTVIVAKNGNVIYKDALGLANREWDIPHTMKGKFIIGSLSKQFIAALSLVLKEEGKLDLNKTIQHYLPEFPNREIGEKVTIHQLLSSTSGLPHYNAWRNFLNNKDRLSYSRAELLDLFREIELEFKPGERYRYSSLGYLILGVVLEKVGGKDLSVLLQEKVFAPSDMGNTSLNNQAKILPFRVTSYRYNFKQAHYDNSNYRDSSTTFSAGGIISNATDLLKWDKALSGTKILSEVSKKLLFTPVSSNYAYGWRTRLPGENRPSKVQWHGGQVTGYRSMMLRLPESGHCIILLSNIRDAPNTEIANQIVSILFGQTVIKPTRSLLKKLLKEIVEKDTKSAVRLYYLLEKTAKEEYSFSEVELLILGTELNSEGMFRQAVDILKLSLKEYPNSRYLFNNLELLGNSFREIGDTAKAISYYEQALKVAPDNQRVKRKLEALKKN